MANWLKAAGIVLIIFGVLAILGSPAVMMGEEISTAPFFAGMAVGIVLAGVGVYLYHLGRKKEKSLAEPSIPAD